MVRKGSGNMQKKAFVRRDMAIFNGIVLLLLIAAVMTLLCFLNNEKELVFLIFACLSFNIIAAYSLGTTKGLYLSIVFVMFFSMYSLYDIVLLEKMGADVYIDFLALLCFPVGGFLGGELSAVVEKNMFKIASVSELEKLVTLDGSTGFYNQQGFFKQLEEEVGRAKRYGTSFSLLLFQISNLQQLQSIYKKQDIMFIKKTVAEIVASKLRFTDCKGILDDGSIGVILPQTESGGLNIVVSKIDTAVGLIPVKLSSAKRMVRVRTSLGYATIENTDTDYKMLYLRAKEDLVNGS
jgi:diguanylate cyclase (GGDEF)-like protein